MTTWILSLIFDFLCLHGKAGDDRGTLARFALDPELSTQAFDPFAHADQAEVVIPIGPLCAIKARAMIRDRNAQMCCFIAHLDLLADATGMTIGIAQRLLHKPIKRDLHRQGSLFRQFTDAQDYGSAGTPLMGAHN